MMLMPVFCVRLLNLRSWCSSARSLIFVPKRLCSRSARLHVPPYFSIKVRRSLHAVGMQTVKRRSPLVRLSVALHGSDQRSYKVSSAAIFSSTSVRETAPPVCTDLAARVYV